MPSSATSEGRRLPTFADVLDAARRLEGHAVLTPLLHSETLDRMVGGRLLVKAEPLQRTGSFKFRGAFNRISRLSPDERDGGVVAYSSGNHAQGVAAAASLLGVKATIVMPTDAPKVKAQGTLSWGAEVVTYDREKGSREEIAARLAADRGVTTVAPFDDPFIIAGQGTAGLELADQAAGFGARLDAVLVSCGGGGLIAGCALALKQRAPTADVYAVEPQGFDNTVRSLEAGTRVEARPGARSFCDALLVPRPGELTFAINRRLLAGGLVVSDDEAAFAMAAAFRHLKLVLEPGGAVALAAALTDKFDCRDRTVAVVASGGNVDPDTFADALRRVPGA
ncbi:MAG: threonine/serine dehydratase [Alphaproteobacteria bacterium]